MKLTQWRHVLAMGCASLLPVFASVAMALLV
jgi:hypothetical protein